MHLPLHNLLAVSRHAVACMTHPHSMMFLPASVCIGSARHMAVACTPEKRITHQQASLPMKREHMSKHIYVPTNTTHIVTAVLAMQRVRHNVRCVKHNVVQIVKASFGMSWLVVYNSLTLIMFLSGLVTTVAVLTYPPLHLPLLASAQIVIGALVAQVVTSAISIPWTSPGCFGNRIGMMLTAAGNWAELSTDWASGVSALRTGGTFNTVCGGVIVAFGCIEFILVCYHTASGLIMHSKRTLLVAATLEVPIFTITIIVLITSWSAPTSVRVAHLVSLLQTVLSLAGNAVWLFIIGPIVFPGAIYCTGCCRLVRLIVPISRFVHK